jgi:hypothetical protein
VTAFEVYISDMNTSFPPRTLHLVDLENLARNPRPCKAEVAAVRARYLDLVPTGRHDLVTVGINHGALLSAGCGWPEARLVVRSGPDGADLALVNVLRSEQVERRFDSVVVASGDGIFVDQVARLATAGCAVTVVARRRSLARRLRLAAPTVVEFEFEFCPVPQEAA